MSSSPRHGATTTVARLETGERSVHKIAALFAERLADEHAAIALVDNGDGRWSVAVHFRDPPDEQAVRALASAAIGAAAAKTLRFEHVAARDWIEESLAGLKPVAAGRFVVHGAHDRGAVAPNAIGIEIEAALAFGTGHHGTTRGCLLALDRICKAQSSPCPRKDARRPPLFRGRNLTIFDLGTGSGVLAIAAARALRRGVLATDIDPSAVRAARANARHNRAGALVAVAGADGVAARAVAARAPFDLVFANILLAPLQRLATPLKARTAPGARVVLSGLLAAQANAALAAYRPLRLERRIAIDGWTTLVLRRGVARRRAHT